MNFEPLTSTKPYLLRAFYEWIVDNGCTPYIIINADYDDVEVPTQYVDDGRIVLNISSSAVRELDINNESVEFDARFGGVAMTVYAPIESVMAIYAHENGRGMVFNDEKLGVDDSEEPLESIPTPTTEDEQPPTPPRGSGGKSGKPKLRLVT
jgi:stringent starvation protein B